MKMGIRRGKKIFAPTFTAIIAIATALTFSACGGDDGGICEGDECGVGGISSSSVGADNNLPSSSSVGGKPSSSSVYVATGGKGNDIANYNTKTIGTQVWMAENLNNDVAGSKCYSNLDSNCDTYGRLYDWSTAMALPSSCNSSACASQVSAKHRGICPSGWHIPTNDEWSTLESYVGGSSVAGNHLKSTTGWSDCGASGSSYSCLDTYGFAALPGGFGNPDGRFYNAGHGGGWWCASETDSVYAYLRGMYYNDEYAGWGSNNKTYLFSVRCLQD